MKLNLLTMHYSLSCGAVLQTYATCKILKQMGCDVTIINFKNPIELRRRKSLKYWLGYGIIKWKFDRFRDKFYPKQTKEFFKLSYEELPYADVYMTGSDQIWNPLVVEQNLFTYMLDFLPLGVKRFSYASSFGIEDWRSYADLSSKVKSELLKFHPLSVREDSGVAICDKYFNLKATQVLDPTLLLDNYSELVSNVKQRNEVVCFKLEYNTDFVKSVLFIRSKLNLKTTLLYSVYPRFSFDKSVMFCSPIEWLKYIASAKLVITDSYHGLVFALIFNKNFIILGGNRKKTTRIRSLLKIVNLESRFLENYDQLIKKQHLLYENIDYDFVNRILEDKRKESLDFLKNAINQNK